MIEKAPPEEVRAAREGAVVFLRRDLSTIEIRGPDRVEFANGMLTNDAKALAVGQGQRSIKVSNKGRIEAYVRVRALPDVLHVDVDASLADKLVETLRGFIIMEDCEVEDISATRDVVTVLGPKSRTVLEAAGYIGLEPKLEDHASYMLDDVLFVRDRTLGVLGWEMHAPAGSGPARRDALTAAGATPVGDAALEVLRVESGTPKDGVELGEDTFPMEARLEDAVSLTKGCFIGQEVIARGTNLGQVNHLLVGWILAGADAPSTATGTAEDASGKSVGELCSVVWSYAHQAWIGLGYVRREHAEPGNTMTMQIGKVSREAAVKVLPFGT